MIANYTYYSRENPRKKLGETPIDPLRVDLAHSLVPFMQQKNYFPQKQGSEC